MNQSRKREIDGINVDVKQRKKIEKKISLESFDSDDFDFLFGILFFFVNFFRFFLPYIKLAKSIMMM